MRPKFINYMIIVSFVASLGCGSGTKVITTTPAADGTIEASKIPAPESSVPISISQEPWLPAMYGRGTGEMLTKALRDQGAVMMILGRGLRTPEWEEQVYATIKATSEKTEVVARATSTLDAILEERGEIPYRTTLEPGGTDVFGRPFLIPVDHPLQTEWLAKKQALKGADAILTVQEVHPDERRIRRLRETRRGGCDELITSLNSAENKALGFFEPYRKALNKNIDAAFSHHLTAAIPFWKEELAAQLSRVDPNGAEAQCLTDLEAFVARYETCEPTRCDDGPFLHMGADGGPVVGMDTSAALLVPDTCITEGMRDYLKEVRDLGSRAVMDAVAATGDEWNSELLRFSELGIVADGMRDFCGVSHRRIHPDDLGTAQQKFATFAKDLGTTTLNGEWIQAGGKDRVPGLGPIDVLARLRNLSASSEIGAAALVSNMKKIDRCTGAGDRILQASMVDVGTSTVVFMGLFFEAQLICDGLPPSSP